MLSARLPAGSLFSGTMTWGNRHHEPRGATYGCPAEGAAMDTGTLRAQRWLRSTDTMLGQVRSLFLGVLLLWPFLGLWGILGHDAATGAAALVAALFLVGWLYAGYRRQCFPVWSW